VLTTGGPRQQEMAARAADAGMLLYLIEL